MKAPMLAKRELETDVPQLVASASGTILEIGPGSGNQVGRYDRSKVNKIYGIEPNKGLHATLQQSIKKAGLSDVYTIVPCGIQDVETLRKYGVDQEAFDTVLSVQVFCSIPNPREAAAAMWTLLKPGGQMVVYEHVKAHDYVSAKVQDLYDVVWPHILSGCHLDRDTATTFREAGEWSEVPNRFNYILWVQDLLDTTSETYNEGYDQEREVVGLDIGTGASCIYPLLGCAQRKTWKFIATDIDTESLDHASLNILLNNLKSRVLPHLSKPTDPLIPLDHLGIERIDFTMTNPPFYPSLSSLLASATLKSRPPHSACTGTETEMVTSGGEVAFVTRIIDESEVLGERCQWYTTMLGKLSSVGEVVEELQKRGVGNWSVKEFVQGEKTRRWGVGWSWGVMRPREVSVFILLGFSFFFAWENTWSRAARRQQQRQKEEEEQEDVMALSEKASDDAGDGESDASHSGSGEDEPEWVLVVKIRLTQGDTPDSVSVSVRWVRGTDNKIFESFCGALKRQLR
ncbi:MAG: hypothetical protein Q9220_003799 [cf. Caloplaca sp. 1 TL-2023]